MSPTPTTLPPTVTPRPTVTTPASPTPDAPVARACDFILRRVPAAVISRALANPWDVFGWMQPANAGLPPGPGNPPRTRLSLRNLGTPYHPLYNPVVFKVGCP